MKMLKLALLGGAALAVTSAGAYADDLSALKAEIEALNSRVAQLEATPSVPAGYQLVTVTTGDAMVVPGNQFGDNRDRSSFGSKATVISVLPTADAPATTSIEWSGYARAALVWTSEGAGNENGELEDDYDVLARGQIRVVGKTDTAVGEVGARVNIRADYDGFGEAGRDTGNNNDEGNDAFYMKEAWGWWAMTPELTLGGGYTGHLGDVAYGVDGTCNCYYTDNFLGFTPGDSTQMRLSYASGPMSAAVSINDGSRSDLLSRDRMGAAGEIAYSGDTVSGEVSAYWLNQDHYVDDEYQIAAGLGFALGDMASISAAIGWKNERGGGENWQGSIIASANLSDSAHAEIGYGHIDFDGGRPDTDTVLAGVYYDPVSQLTIGLEAEWADYGGSDDWTRLDLVTVFRF